MESRPLFLLACLLTPLLAAGCVFGGSDDDQWCVQDVGCVGEDPRLRRAPGCQGITTCLWLPEEENRTVGVLDNQFVPGVVNARVGETVRWVHFMRGEHTVTFREPANPHNAFLFDARDPFKLDRQGDSLRLMPVLAGTYAYACKFHPEMQGTLVVGAANATPQDNPPVAAFTAPLDAVPRGVVRLEGVAFDPDREAVTASLRVGEETALPLSVEGMRWRAAWDASGVEGREHEARLRVEGRGTAEATARVRLDEPRIRIEVERPAPDEEIGGGVVRFEGAVTATQGDLATFGWRVLPEGNLTLLAVRDGAWSFELDARTLPDGPLLVELEASARDGYRVTRVARWVVDNAAQ